MFDSDVFTREKSDSDEISASLYNFIIGAVLLWGFFLTAVIQKACELLAYGKMNVSEIASKLGYSNVHNFSRSFSKTMKVSPKKYRRGG